MASKWQKVLGSIAQIGGPILGGIIGGPGGAAAGGAIGGALSGQKGALKQAGIGAGLGYAGAKLGGVQGQGFGNLLSNPLQSIGNAFSNINPFKSGTLYGATAGAPSAFSGITSSGPGTNVGMGRSLPTQQSNQGNSFNLGGLSKNPLLLGLGTMLGSQFIGSPKVPELPQSVLDFQNAARQGNPLQNQAAAALSQQLGQNMEQVSEEEIAAAVRELDRAKEQEVGSIQDIYRSLRPGSDYASDSSYKKDIGDVENRYAIRRADTVSQLRRQVSNDFNNQRAQQIASASGLGQQQLQQLAQLSQFDLERQLQQLGIEDRDKQVLRDYLLQFGGNLASSQLDLSKALEMQLYQKLLNGGKI